MVSQPFNPPEGALDVLTRNARDNLNPSTSLRFGDLSQPAPTSNSSGPLFDPNTFKSITPYVPTIQKYFGKDSASKASWTSHWENTEGTPNTISPIGPNPPQGRATGLFQILPQYIDDNGVLQNPNRPTQAQLQDPETNIKTAAWLAYGAPGRWQDFQGPTQGQTPNFSDWQDNPKPGEAKWGALAVHPYPGDAGVHLPESPLPPDYQTKLTDTKTLLPLLSSSRLDQIAAIRDFEADPSNYTTVETSNSSKSGNPLGLNIFSNPLGILGIGNSPIISHVPTSAANTKLNEMRTNLARTVELERTTSLFADVLQDLPQVITDSDTNIKNVDDFFDFFRQHRPGWANGYGTQADPEQLFSDEQKSYIGDVIAHLSPYTNQSGPKPITQNQLSQFLAASATSDIPSTRVSIASLSNDAIRSVLTTLPGDNIKLPPGMTEESLRGYYASSEFASPEAQEQIKSLKGTAKNLVASWVRQDNQYQAIKLNLLDPTTLPILQGREMNIGQWSLDKLGFWSKNVSRPLATFGILGVDGALKYLDKINLNVFGVDIHGSNVIPVAGPILSTGQYLRDATGIALDKLGISAPTQELRSDFYTNIRAGANPWQAAGDSFETWHANGLIKFFAETAADPLTYVGFGVYTPVTHGIPILGPTVEAVERGMMAGFEHPIIAKVGLTATGAGLGYQATGDWKGALVGASGLGVLGVAGPAAVLRGIPLFSESQLIRNRINSEEGLMALFGKAIAITNHLPQAEGASAEEIRKTISLGMEQIRTNGVFAHTTEEGNFVKGLVSDLTPLIKSDELSAMLATSREIIEEAGMNLPSGRMTAEVRNDFSIGELHDINKAYDLMLNSNTGVLSPTSVADLIKTTLSMPELDTAKLADALVERYVKTYDRIGELTATNDPNAMVKGIREAATDGYRLKIRDDLWFHGQFQGYVSGLQNTFSPVTKLGLYKFLATVQSGITSASLKYLGFGYTHFLEIPFRSFIGGVGPNLTMNADKIGEARLFHGWNTASPINIKNYDDSIARSVASISGKEAPISEAALNKDKSLFTKLRDLSKLHERAFGLTKAAAYLKFVPDEVARAAPEEYSAMKSSVDTIMAQLSSNRDFSSQQLEAIRSSLVNYSFRPDAPELLRKLAGDVPAIERRAFHQDVQTAADQYTSIDEPYKNAIMQQVQRGNLEDPTSGIYDSMLEHEVAKSAAYSEELHNFSQAFVDNLSSAVVPRYTPKIEGIDLSTAPSVIEAPTTAYHGSGSELTHFAEGAADPAALFGPGTYLTSDPSVAEGYAKGRATRMNSRRTREVNSGTSQRFIDENYPVGKATVHEVNIAPNQKLLNLEQPMPTSLADKFESMARDNQYPSGIEEGDAWRNAAKAIREDKKGTEVYKEFTEVLSNLNYPSYEAGEVLDQFNNILRQDGYDGLAHIGGGIFNKADTRRHNVTVLFDESKAIPAAAQHNKATLSGLLRELNTAHVSSTDALADIVQSGAERAGSLTTEEGKNLHWERVNKAVSDYQSSAQQSLTQMADALRQHISEPPVPEGMTRLYRGDTGQIANGPDWVKANQGNWFTTNRDMAKSYGELGYVDVRSNLVSQYSTENIPGYGPVDWRSINPNGAPVRDEYILPKEISSLRKPIISDKIQDIFHAAINNIQDRTSLINNTRNSLESTITDYMAAHGGHRPTGNDWPPIIAKRAEIWRNHLDQDARLLGRYNSLATDFNPTLGVPPTAQGGLTVQHISQWYHSSGDEIANSLVGLQSIMRKETFVQSIYGQASSEAIRAGTSPESLGWSEEALGNLYDQIRVRLNTDPAESGTLSQARSQIDSLRQDIQALRISRGWKPETADTLQNAFASHAQFMSEHPFPQEKITTAYEKSRLRYEQTFIDYSHDNIFDAVIKSVYPFWVHQSQRWPWLFNSVLAHPGLGTALGRYQDYTDKGYIHIPGSDIAFNIIRGNSIMGGFGPLFSQFPANYESGVLGKAGQVYDQMGKAGFYPGFWATLPLNITHVVDFNLPAPIGDTIAGVDIAANAVGIDSHLLKIRDYLFPSKFRDYYTAMLVSEYADKNDLDIKGDTVRRHIEDGSATSDEQALWTAAQKKFSRYQVLFDQTGVMKLDPEARRAAALEAALAIQDATGLTPSQQDAITSRLGSSGLRLTDVFPLDPATSKHIYELSKFKNWAGLATALQPSELRQTEDKISEFWDTVVKKEEEAKSAGFTKTDGTKVPSLDSLDADFRAGRITSKQWNIQQSQVKQEVAAEIEGLKKSKQFDGVPISLEDRQKYAESKGTKVPVDHPAKELLNLYYGITPKLDPVTGNPNFEDYFATIDGLLNVLPPDKKTYLLDYIQKSWTPTQKLLWSANTNYLRSYNNVKEGILDALAPDQQAFIRAYSKTNPGLDEAVIDNLPENQAKLLKDYASAVNRAQTRYRQLSPMTDAWLYYWGKSGTLETESARQDYNHLVSLHPGPHTMDTPVVAKKPPLTPLTTDGPTN